MIANFKLRQFKSLLAAINDAADLKYKTQFQPNDAKIALKST